MRDKQPLGKKPWGHEQQSEDAETELRGQSGRGGSAAFKASTRDQVRREVVASNIGFAEDGVPL